MQVYLEGLHLCEHVAETGAGAPEALLAVGSSGLASAFVDKKTQVIYKRLKKYCKDCENPMRAIRHAIEKDPKTPPKPNYCEHCFKKCKPVLHHNHKTGKFVRWACVNCNSRFTKDTFEEYLEFYEKANN